MCRNHRTVQQLREAQFTAVRYPRSGLLPGLVIAKQGSRVDIVGWLDEIPSRIKHPRPIPNREVGAPCSDIHTVEVLGHAGSSLLKGLATKFQALSGSVDLNSHRTDKVILRFDDITWLQLLPSAFEPVINDILVGKAKDSGVWGRFFKAAELFVVTEVLTSARFDAELHLAREEKIADNVKAAGLGHASASMQSKDDRIIKTTYEATQKGKPLTFAFKAMRLRVDEDAVQLELAPQDAAAGFAAVADSASAKLEAPGELPDDHGLLVFGDDPAPSDTRG